MRGEPGTDVQLTIVRAGLDEPLHFTITRASIHVNYVEGQTLVAPGIGYLNLTSVSQTAPRELMEAINELRSTGARELILDLRSNPGGVLDQGVAIADLFLDRGDKVVEMKGRAERASQIFTDARPQLWPDMPMIVLVGARTASAAEIIAGALQDHDRALILGTPTFGKGTAYTLLRLTETEALTVTTSRWYTPSGRSIDRRRFRHLPDQSVANALAAQDSIAMDTTIAYRSESGRLLKGGGGIRPDVEVLDTLTAPEQQFAETLGADVPKYRDALARYALEIKARNTVVDGDFIVTTAMLQELLALLRQKGVTMPDSIWFGARTFLAEQLGFEITRYVFGRPAELNRRLRYDTQVARAIALLQAASSQEELLAIVPSN
jgi:carboxyl-terminal processing protease